MNIPINAKVYCQGKFCGHTQAVILNPIRDVVTHVVVKESSSPHTERVIPIDLVDASLSTEIDLAMDETKLKNMPPFFDVEYIQTTIPHYSHIYDMSYLEPVVVAEEKILPEKLYHIPKDELAVKRGSDIYSVDGQAIGKVDEFLVDESGHHVTHLILREAHFLGQKDVFIPVSGIESIEENSLHLKLSQDEIKKLPTIPVRRTWSSS